MNKTRSTAQMILIGSIFAMLYWVLIHFVLFPILIPDICYYHNHETTVLVDLFFDFPSYEGYHPVPSLLGYILTFGIGAFLSKRISRKVKREI